MNRSTSCHAGQRDVPGPYMGKQSTGPPHGAPHAGQGGTHGGGGDYGSAQGRLRSQRAQKRPAVQPADWKGLRHTTTAKAMVRLLRPNFECLYGYADVYLP